MAGEGRRTGSGKTGAEPGMELTTSQRIATGCRGKGMAEHSGALRTKSTVLGVDGINTEMHLAGMLKERP
ncbi:uncharacterized protein CIMG_01347 [Coccidioides immitis RS]|uniref:Uncharacterized protein n=1 Tax=Coccidioides immitis (strain RS) TaxID=246410 RepID=A0A0E1RYN6_COCIM|nr:uncharacterized protein CIMG_01347 [Coccidioides immitis RS]EAS35993.2 hypothetical protein CIMG_01347 [Coccidioides immitis RS]